MKKRIVTINFENEEDNFYYYFHLVLFYMKKYLFHFVFLVFLNSVNSQILNGKIEYSLHLAEDESFSKGELSGYFNQAKEAAVYVSYTLEFNKNEMNFYSTTPKIDGINTSFSLAFSGITGIYYRKIKENIVLNSIDDPVLGKIIVRNNYETDWELSQESKMIEGFLCYKATATVQYNNGVKDFEKQLIVWYCPEIPYSYGPKGYGNLPGMILQFQDRNIVIGVKKITFNTEKNEIAEPKGKIITQEEYSELLTKYFENEED